MSLLPRLAFCSASLCALLAPAALLADTAVGPWGMPHVSVLPPQKGDAAKKASVLGAPKDFTQAEALEDRSAGAGTLMPPFGPAPFSHPSPKLPEDQRLDFTLGEALFEKLWVVAPSSTISSDGLGPLYNARACSACHVNDGRAVPPSADHETPGLMLRLSVPGEADKAPFVPEPTYGAQLQDRAIAGQPAEAKLRVAYTPFPVTLDDGTVVELRAPLYEMRDLAHGAASSDLMTSPRIAPQMIGLGLLEAISEADILAQADPEDANGDGISGRPNRVWSREYDQWMLGRFGHKAGNPTVRQQSADAANGDIGLSNPLFPNAWGDCTEVQADCRNTRDGNTPEQGNHELGQVTLDLITLYTAHLAVPARRGEDSAQVLRGKKLFYSSGCTGCHTPKYVTPRLDNDPARSFQLIWPYTDLLLHDMGPGLADQRPEWQADGQEWRTPPLWGLGLTKTVSGETAFLHDGRAQTLLEAILWHGGEAQSARDSVRGMDAPDRDTLIAFLESL